MTTYADFETFADDIGQRRRRAEQLTPGLLSTLRGAATPDEVLTADEPVAEGTAGAGPSAAEGTLAASVHATSGLLVDTIGDLGRAEEELRVQNEALFAAHIELCEEHQVFRDLFEHAPVAYVVTTGAGVLRRVNAAATRLLARPANFVIGKPLCAYIALGDRGAFRAALARSVESHHPETWRVRVVPRGGAEVECRIHMRVVRPVSRDAASPDAEALIHWIITEAVWDTAGDLV